MTVPAVVIERESHKVVAAGEDVVHLQFEVEMDHYGTFSHTSPITDSILAEMGPPYTVSWTGTVERETPHSEDQYPMAMPKSIGNLGFRGDPDDGITASRSEEVDVIYMSHLFVQEEARRIGYGQLLWDFYLAVVAYGNYRAAGGVGSTEGSGTVRFLRRQGVPEDDIDPGRHAGGSGTTRWSTDASNVVAAAPIRRTEVVLDG